MENFKTKLLLIGLLHTVSSQSQILAKPGSKCSQQSSTKDTDCDIYTLDEIIPSVWTGNYTCTDDAAEIPFMLNITRSSSIDIQGHMYLNGEQLNMSGVFANAFQIITMQNDRINTHQIANQNFTAVELNGRVRSSVYIDGVIIFQSESGRYNCPMVLQMQKETIWCSGHGNCQRFGPRKDEYSCCCEQSYTGNLCELEKSTNPPSTTTAPTVIPCYPANNCLYHYMCGPFGQKICMSGWTGEHCDILITDGPADCNVFDQEEFIPSEWIGNYTCNDDLMPVNFRLNITRSTSSMGTTGNILIGNKSIEVVGSFASFFNTFTLQGQDLVVDEIFHRNFTDVELDGVLRSPLYINGKIIFSLRNGISTCDAELHRNAVYIDWCSLHGSCYRYGPKRDQFSCCCDQAVRNDTRKIVCKDNTFDFLGYDGYTCELLVASSTVISATQTATANYTLSTVESTSKTPAETTDLTTSALPTLPFETTVEETLKVTKTLMTTIQTSKGLKLEDAIRPGCTPNGWNITVDMPVLRKLYPTIKTNHIYFGDNSCRGVENGASLVFQQGFRDCLTSERVSGDTLLYENELFYAVYDPINPFIIRQHEWTFKVECDISRNEATSSHVHHNVDAHHAAVGIHYNINMTFFKDANFMREITGNPIQASIGDDIYIKVFTSAADWTIKMRLQTCYTKPVDDADDAMTYYIIKNGCEIDSNTHIISQSTHETRFVFQDFEYSTNREGLNIYCNATFCETKDYSPGCAQSCISPGTQALIGK